MLYTLKPALKALDLSDKQIAVLHILLESGTPMLASGIARTTKLNRTSIYDILRELTEKGLVSRVQKKGVMRYESIAVELLPTYVERRREALDESKRQLAEAIPQIKLMQLRGKALPKVRFFEGIEGIKQAYEDTVENNKEKILYALTGTDAAYRTLDAAWLEYYFAKRHKLGVKARVIAPDTAWSAFMYKNEDAKRLRETSLIPAAFAFASEVCIYDDKVSIFSFSEDHPIAVIIEDKTFHDTMKTLFDFISQHAK